MATTILQSTPISENFLQVSVREAQEKYARGGKVFCMPKFQYFQDNHKQVNKNTEFWDLRETHDFFVEKLPGMSEK